MTQEEAIATVKAEIQPLIDSLISKAVARVRQCIKCKDWFISRRYDQKVCNKEDCRRWIQNIHALRWWRRNRGSDVERR